MVCFVLLLTTKIDTLWDQLRRTGVPDSLINRSHGGCRNLHPRNRCFPEPPACGIDEGALYHENFRRLKQGTAPWSGFKRWGGWWGGKSSLARFLQKKSGARLASPQPRPTSPVNGAGGN